MGMNLHSKAPSSRKGSEFNSNYWYWRPIARYVQAEHPELYAKVRYWESNDGDGLDAAHSKLLGERILADVEAGKVDAYARTRKDGLPAKDYPFDVEVVREFGEYLRDCGGFEIW